jgi:hypothetical protein
VQRFLVALLELLSFCSVTALIFSYSLCSLEPVFHNVSVFICILPWQGTFDVRNFFANTLLAAVFSMTDILQKYGRVNTSFNRLHCTSVCRQPALHE